MVKPAQAGHWFVGLMTTDRHIIEFQNSVLCIIVGAIFFVQTNEIYDRFPDTYEYIEFLPAWGWGILYLVAGLCHFIALVMGARAWRKNILLVKGTLWAWLAGCVMQADPVSIGGYFYVVFALVAFRSFLQIQIFNNVTPANKC